MSYSVYGRANLPPQVRVDTGPGRTKQHFKEEVDINNVLKAYRSTGQLPPGLVQNRQAMFVDVSEDYDLLRCFEVAERAEKGFAALPATVRQRFNGDPVQLLVWVSDPANRDEAVKLGLLEGAAPVVGVPTVEVRSGDAPVAPGSGAG